MHLDPPVTTLCQRCGTAVESRSRNTRKWCSETCRVQAYNERTGRPTRWPQSTVAFRYCRSCGQLFSARRVPGGKPRRTCSAECRAQYKRDMEVQRRANMPVEKVAPRLSMRREAGARRRARQRGASTEPFSEWDVFARDDWVCALCGEAIDPTAVHPDPRRASLDHIIPLSRGGEHSLANSAATHLNCNIRRGNRPVGEVDAI